MAVLTLSGVGSAYGADESNAPAASQTQPVVESDAAQAAAQAAKAAQVAAQAAQAAAQAAEQAVKEVQAEQARKEQSPAQAGSVPQGDTAQSTGKAAIEPVKAGQAVPQAQPIIMQDQYGKLPSSQTMTQTYRRVTDAEMKALENQAPPSPTQAVVNGANVGDFLGSGVQLDRRAMDAVVDREYNSLGRLDPLKPGEAAPSVDQDVENKNLAEAKKNMPKRKGLRAFIHGCANAFSDVGSMLGFPIGPDEDDARMDKFDGM
jgi:hypothetical protein